jgi:glutamate dehydrogenase (NAD(P)+)
MPLYDHPTFRMAANNLIWWPIISKCPCRARSHQIPEALADRCAAIHLDDGSTRVFTGYRVQHHLTLGPTKGGLRYHPDVTPGGGGAGNVDELEMCVWPGCRTAGPKVESLVTPESKAWLNSSAHTALYQEMIPFIGPQVDVMAPDLGTNGTSDGMDHDTVLCACGLHRAEHRHG